VPNILVVDDSSFMRQFIKCTVSGIPGARVIEAADGADALRVLRSEKIDLILTDIVMPVMDGLKLLGHVKSNFAYRDIPVVVITCRGDELRERVAALGARACMQKPIETDELVGLVGGLIGA
jgi:two-component system chemotaxis response regulator CheY